MVAVWSEEAQQWKPSRVHSPRGYERVWQRAASSAARDPRAVRALIDRAIDTHAPDMLPTQREQVEADLTDDICGLGPLQVLMDDPGVEEIWINSASRVFVARGGVAELTSLILTDEDVRTLVERMLHHSGRRLDLSSPFVDAMLAGGERLHVVIPPVTGRSWSVNIRKHIQRARTLDDLVAVDMVSPPMRDFLSAAVCVGLSVLVSGGTQAGKTTLLRALAGELPRSRRVISCEEVFELGLANWDHVAMQTRPAAAEGTGRDHAARPRARIPAYAPRVPNRPARYEAPKPLTSSWPSTRACPVWQLCTRTRRARPSTSSRFCLSWPVRTSRRDS